MSLKDRFSFLLKVTLNGLLPEIPTDKSNDFKKKKHILNKVSKKQRERIIL